LAAPPGRALRRRGRVPRCAGRLEAGAECGDGCGVARAAVARRGANAAPAHAALCRPRAVLQSIGLLLSEPNPDDSLMADIVRAAGACDFGGSPL
jgi:hypothetical protein